MKSKRAKDQLDFNLQHYKELGEELLTITTIRSNVETIVELAEQDAEARAVKAADKLYDDLEPIFLHPVKREWIIEKFEEFYNNGGQSDEK